MRGYEYTGYLKRVAGMMSAMEKKRDGNFEVPFILELQNAALVAEATVLAALRREESRGAHFRDDFGVKDDSKFKITLIKMEGIRLFHRFEERGVWRQSNIL